MTRVSDSCRWDDPLIEACEGARCPCGHQSLTHAWGGCEKCRCVRSAPHALLDSGVVEVRVIRPVEVTTW